MNIAAISDMHGELPDPHSFDPVDVVVIAGDVVNLYVQQDNYFSKIWFERTFFDWVRKLRCDKVIMIAGNHDFYLESEGLSFNDVIKENKLQDKLVYLQDSSYTYRGKTFYGCPWCEGPMNWAFCPNLYNMTNVYKHFDRIPDCDMLIVHQPSRVGELGTSHFKDYNREFGSEYLRDVVRARRISAVVCGHIHSGEHQRVDDGDTKYYNVSLLDENYDSVYPISYITL